MILQYRQAFGWNFEFIIPHSELIKGLRLENNRAYNPSVACGATSLYTREAKITRTATIDNLFAERNYRAITLFCAIKLYKANGPLV